MVAYSCMLNVQSGTTRDMQSLRGVWACLNVRCKADMARVECEGVAGEREAGGGRRGGAGEGGRHRKKQELTLHTRFYR
jgi:hypothetical protein